MSRRKKYDREFKLSVMELFKDGKQSVRAVAEEMGINYYTLLDWKREYEKKGSQAFVGSGHTSYATEAEAEIARLRKEIHRLRMERDILKKAMAISLNEK